MFGVWMWPESVRLRGADRVFDACRRAGVKDVFFLTKGLSGTTAFLTPLAPPMEQGRDLFREALDAAHARGIRLHAWFTSASDRHYLEEHPEAGLVHYTKGPGREIVSITDKTYAAYLSAVLAELLDRYEADGVHLDYIRYNHLICGWSAEDRRRYAEAGADLSKIDGLMARTFLGDKPDKEAIFDAFRAGDRDVRILSEVRRHNVNAFAAAMTETVRQSGRDVTLSMALMPEGSYDDLAFSDLHYGQHYADLARYADLFLPMAYSQAYGKGPDWVCETARGTMRHGVRTLVGVQAYEGGTGITLRDDLCAARESGADGACLFREGGAVWAFRDGQRLSVLNPLGRAVSSFLVGSGADEEKLEEAVGAGEERVLDLPFVPNTVRAFDGDGREVCVFTADERR